MKHSQRYANIILAVLVVGFVGIASFFAYQNNQLTLRKVPADQTIDTDTNSLKDWKKFTHKLGYSFQYPQNLEAISLTNSDIVELQSTEHTSPIEDREFEANIYMLKNDDRLSLKEFIEKKEGIVNGRIPSTTEYFGTPFFREIIAFEKKSVDGKEGYFFRADPCSICRGETYSTYIKLSPTMILQFDIFVDKESGNTENYRLYDKILSTFKFNK